MGRVQNMNIPVMFADYPSNMPLVVVAVIAVVGFVGTLFSLASSKKPDDQKTAKMMLGILGFAFLIWVGYVLLKDLAHHK